MIVLRTPKGWTAPAEVDGHKSKDFGDHIKCRWRMLRKNPAHLKLLEEWMRSYKPEELFDENGTLVAE